MLPLVIAPHGGELGSLTVDRALLTTRSFEYDAVIVTGPMPPAPDATPSRDAKTMPAAAVAVDPRVKLMLEEMFRHCKAIAALPAGAEVLTAAGIPGDAIGVVTGDSADAVVGALRALVQKHRLWERFPARAGQERQLRSAA
jgi:catalase